MKINKLLDKNKIYFGFKHMGVYTILSDNPKTPKKWVVDWILDNIVPSHRDQFLQGVLETFYENK